MLNKYISLALSYADVNVILYLTGSKTASAISDELVEMYLV